MLRGARVGCEVGRWRTIRASRVARGDESVLGSPVFRSCGALSRAKVASLCSGSRGTHAQSFGTEPAGMRTPQGASGPASAALRRRGRVKRTGAQVVFVAHTVTPRLHVVAREECARGGWDGLRCRQQSARTGRLYADLCSTLQHTSAGEDDTLVYGVSEMQGWRISMSSALPHR